MLQELLNAGLVDIGGDDTRFAKMQSAASALAARFKREPALLIPATLIALDSSADEMDPMFILVEELVIAEWNTLRNTHVNRPRELLRSIIIDALAASIAGSAEAAAAVWNTAVGPLRHRQIRLGKAAPLVEKFLKGASRTAEAEAVSRASLASPSSTKRANESGPVENAKLDFSNTIKDDELIRDVARAAGPQYPAGQALDNTPNPQWSNSAPAWSNEFTPRMTATLVKAVNLGTARLGESLGARVGTLEKQLTEHLQADKSPSHDPSRMRLEVLWWSEALYSPTLETGYRDLDLPIAAAAAAVDLVSLVPALAPASVAHVLAEAVLRTARPKKADSKQPVLSYLDALATAKPNFGRGFPSATNNDGRLPLLALVGEATMGRRVTAEVLRSRAGIEEALGLSAGEFAMWVFADLQAHRLVEALR